MAEEEVFVGNGLDVSQTIESWWAEAHARSDRGWLTGSYGRAVWDSLAVSSRVVPGRAVLNIGVGLGQCTRDLVDAGCAVSVLDICPLALDRVRDVVQACYLASELDRLPDAAFDLAISHLVTQHMVDADLDPHVRHVLRSLGPDGLFAMQFAYGWDQETGIAGETLADAKTGGVIRKLSHMAALVERAGGMISRAHIISNYPQYRSGWYGIHITKRPA